MAQSASKPQSMTSTQAKQAGPDRVRVEFRIDDLVRELIKERGTLVADLGCNGCSACSMSDTVVPSKGER